MESAGTIEVLYVEGDGATDAAVGLHAPVVRRATSGDTPRLSVTEIEDATVIADRPEPDCVVADTEQTAWRAVLSMTQDQHPEVPVVLTGPVETAVPAFRAGATDFVANDADELPERVMAAAGSGASEQSTDSPDDHELRGVALDAAGSLLSATPDELDAKVEFTLQSLCDRLSIPRAATYLPDEAGGYERRHAVHAGDPLAATPNAAWVEPLQAFRPVRYGPQAAHPSEDPVPPRDRSGVVAPLVSNWELVGFIVFDDPAGRRWTDTEVTVLKTVGELTAQALERRRRVRELRAQNERLERFASVVSHDLRNPLNTADGWLEMARTGNEQAFDRVERSLGRMEALIEDVLTLAQDGIDVGDTEPVTVESVARKAWTQVAADDASLDVTAVGTVEADETRLASLFENLFRNSVEHAGREVSLQIGPTDTGFYVADDGPGLPTDTDELFEWGTTTGDGTGLGLAIVEQVATGHGWRVSADNDDGARFEFDLCRSKDPVEA